MRLSARIGLGVPALLMTLSVAAPAGATVYLSPSGNDSAACTAAAPCRSFDRGYRVSPAGGEVELAAGTYGSQPLSGLPVKASAAKVVFRPAAGAAVKLGSLTISRTSNVEVRSVATAGWGVTNGSAHVILRDVTANDLSFAAGYFSGADDVQVIGGEIARADPDDGIHMNKSGGSNTNITIDGLFMHDLTNNRDRSSHNDCIQTGDVTNLVIRNSRFINCGTQGVFLNPYNGGVTRNVLLENNWFGQAQLGYNILYIGDAVGVTVRNNSFTGQVHTYNKASFTHLKMVNNIFGGNDAYNCADLVSKSEVFDYNASSAGCSGAKHHVTQSTVKSQFTSVAADASAFNLHLKAGAATIDKGSPTDSAGNDFDGQRRPIGGAPDIGADEYGTGPNAPPTPLLPAPPTPPLPAPPVAGGGSGTPAAPTAPTAGLKPPASAAVAGVLASLPATTAAAFGKVDAAQIGSKAPLALAGVDDARICRSARKGCAATTRLRIAMTKSSTLKIVFRKVRPGHRSKIVRVTRLRLRAGANVVRVRGRGLGAGRYHLILRAPNGASADVPLKVS
jgi:hypothetical protein